MSHLSRHPFCQTFPSCTLHSLTYSPFLLQTTIKLMYWSFLVYDYQEEKAGAPSPYSPDTALLLYGLEHWECMWERSLDTKAIVGWSSDTVRWLRACVWLWWVPHPGSTTAVQGLDLPAECAPHGRGAAREAVSFEILPSTAHAGCDCLPRHRQPGKRQGRPAGVAQALA